MLGQLVYAVQPRTVLTPAVDGAHLDASGRVSVRHAHTLPHARSEMQRAIIQSLLTGAAICHKHGPTVGAQTALLGFGEMLYRLALAAALCVAFSGCGASALRRHVMAAEALDAALDADAEALEARIRLEARRAAADCPDQTFAECAEAEAHGVADELDRWEAAHSAAIIVRDSYVQRLQEAAQSEEGLADLRPFLHEALDVFRRLAEVARSYGIDVPSVGEGVRWLIQLL
jgi:hypothetical protein